MLLDLDPRSLDMVIGRYEQVIESLIESEVQKGSLAFDVGANVGYFTLLMATRAGASGSVVSFEPNPAIAQALRRNVSRNGHSIGPVLVIENALGRASGVARFERPQRHTKAKIVSSGGEIEVGVVTLDDEAARHGYPDFVKIDVEGAEVEVLGGATSVLERGPVVVIEAHSPELQRACADILEGLGYELTVSDLRGRRESYIIARRSAAEGA